MNFIDKIKNLRKDVVYNIYQAVVEEPLDYEKMTRKTMGECILAFYQNPKQLIRLLTDHDIELLRNIEQGKDDLIQLNSSFLKENGIVMIDPEENRMVIPSEIMDSVHAITSGEVGKEGIDLKMEWLLGLLYVNGPMPFDMFIKKIGFYLVDENEEELGDELIEAPFFNSRVFLEGECIVLNEYMPLMEKKRKKMPYFAKAFDFQELKDIGNTRFNLQNKKVKAFVEKYQHTPDYVFDMLLRDIQVMEEHVTSFLFHYFEEEDLLDVIPEIYSYTLHGLSQKEYDEHTKNKERLSKQFTQIKQTNAHLSKEEGELFNELYFSLLNYISQEFDITPQVIDYASSMLDPSACVEARETLFKLPRMIDKYCDLNPDHVSEEDLRLVEQFKNMRVDIFTIVKYDENYSYFIDSHNCYGVKGVTHNIQSILQQPLPIMVHTCLLPFKNHIIYDGFLRPLAMSFGDGSLQMFLDEMNRHQPVYTLTDKN